MTLAPVIVRELRAEARRPANYWLRVFGAAAVLGAMAIEAASQGGFRVGQGGAMFVDVNLTLFVTIWIVVPLITADCISRERREGTLGLLFLTPLRARDIVTAKCAVHATRALTFLLTAFPILMVPLLLGGVSGMEVVRVILLDLGALCLALCAGVLASCLCVVWARALAMAAVLSFVSGFVFVALHTVGRVIQIAQMLKVSLTPKQFLLMLWGYLGNLLTHLPTGQAVGPSFGRLWGRTTATSDAVSLLLAGALLLVSVLLGIWVMRLAVRNIEAAWQDEPPSARREWLVRTFWTPRFGRGLFRQRLRAALARNPIGWLHQYSTGARLVKWGWCLALLIGQYIMVFFVPWSDHLATQQIFGWFLALGLAFSAAGSFQRERQNRVLELLLVTPMSARAIVLGRLRGLWEQFLPAFALLGLVYGFLGYRAPSTFRADSAAFLVWLAIVFVTLPVIGLRFSLNPRHIVTNWILTAATGLLLAWVAAWVVVLLGVAAWRNLVETAVEAVAAQVLVQLVVAAVAGRQLLRQLERRSFLEGAPRA